MVKNCYIMETCILIVHLIYYDGECPYCLNLITQHMWDMSIFIAIAYRFYLTPLFSFRWLMMNVRMKGMGLAAPLALLYHHKIIAESCNNKDNRCCLLYLIRNNNPASLFPMCSLLVVPCISAYYLHVFSSTCVHLLCGGCRKLWLRQLCSVVW